MAQHRQPEWLMPAMIIVLIVLMVPLYATFALAQGANPQSKGSADKSPLQSGYAVDLPGVQI